MLTIDVLACDVLPSAIPLYLAERGFAIPYSFTSLTAVLSNV